MVQLLEATESAGVWGVKMKRESEESNREDQDTCVYDMRSRPGDSPEVEMTHFRDFESTS